jgi:hypothetical protein
MLREKSALVVKIHKGLDIALTVIAFVGAYLKIPAASSEDCARCFGSSDVTFPNPWAA